MRIVSKQFMPVITSLLTTCNELLNQLKKSLFKKLLFK